MASCGPKDISPAQAAPKEHVIAPAAHGGAPMGMSPDELRARGGVPVYCSQTGRLLGHQFPAPAASHPPARTSGQMQNDPNMQRPSAFPPRGAPMSMRPPVPQQQRFAAPPPPQHQRQQQQQQFAGYAHGGEEFAQQQQQFFEHGGELVDPAHEARVADLVRMEVSKQLGMPQRGMFGGAAAETEEVTQHGGAPASDLDVGAAAPHDHKACLHGGCSVCTMDHPEGCRCGSCARVYSQGFWEQAPSSVTTAVQPPRATGQSGIPDPIRAVPASTIVPPRKAAPPAGTMQPAQRPGGVMKAAPAARTARPPPRR